MKIGLTSDLHGFLPEQVPDCDVLFIGGDVCPVSDHSPSYQEGWLKNVFAPWLAGLGMPVVGVAGNHDFIADRSEGRTLMRSLPWTYLEDEGADIQGLSVYGSPYSNQFGRWAFMEPEDELAYRWIQIPSGLDVLITHGPAYGLLDRVNNNWSPDPHVGSQSLREAVLDKKPRVHLVGHIHEGYGRVEFGKTAMVNGSYCDDRYSAIHNPIQVLSPGGGLERS